MVIVGGGHVARQKVEALLPTKAQLIVVSPKITETLQRYVHEGFVTWRNKEFEPADLDDASLIFAVTDDEEVNNAVEEAAQHWQLLSRADAKGALISSIQPLFGAVNLWSPFRHLVQVQV